MSGYVSPEVIIIWEMFFHFVVIDDIAVAVFSVSVFSLQPKNIAMVRAGELVWSV